MSTAGCIILFKKIYTGGVCDGGSKATTEAAFLVYCFEWVVYFVYTVGGVIVWGHYLIYADEAGSYCFFRPLFNKNAFHGTWHIQCYPVFQEHNPPHTGGCHENISNDNWNSSPCNLICSFIGSRRLQRLVCMDLSWFLCLDCGCTNGTGCFDVLWNNQRGDRQNRSKGRRSVLSMNMLDPNFK